jgi:hypothetical protein
MAKIIRSNKNITCSECGYEATPEETFADKIRMHEAGQDKRILCECCHEEYQERWEEYK